MLLPVNETSTALLDGIEPFSNSGNSTVRTKLDFVGRHQVPNFYNAGLNPNPRNHLSSPSPHEANLLGSAACQALPHNSGKLGACPCELRF